MNIIENGSTPLIVFLLVNSDDGLTGATGKTPAATVSKNGAAFGAVAGAVSEIGSGWYKVSLSATETNTDGPLAIDITATDTLGWREKYQVKSTALFVSDFNRAADHYLRRPFASARASSYGDTITTERYTMLGFALRLQGKQSVSGAVLTIKKEDGSTTAYDLTLGVNEEALPITSID